MLPDKRDSANLTMIMSLIIRWTVKCGSIYFLVEGETLFSMLVLQLFQITQVFE
jgi:hypothetical protein